MSENIQNLQDASVDAGVPKALNYIEKLVAELCPEGVEYVELGRLGKRNSGTSITAAKMKQIKNPDGEIRIFAAGNNNITAKSNDVPEKDILLGPSIIVKSRGHIGFEYYEGKFTHKSELWSYTLNNGEVNQKYVYYFLLTCSQYLQKLARSKSVKLPQLAVRDTDNLLVPIPPLEVQNAIVDILDKFTKLEAEREAELEAELASRRAQYEYYRNSLFENLRGGSEILGDLVQYVRDKTKSLMKPLEYVGVENLNVDFQGCTASLSTISGTRYIPSDILLGNIRPYLKKMWISNNEGIAGSDVLVIRIKDEYRNDIVPKFLYYQLTTSRFVDYNVRNSRGGKMPRGNKKKILEFPIFLPPFAEQERIVKILDKFDALVNDISSGLPAEIEARRKQYEYYRDRLLTFPRASDSTEHKQ